MKNLLNDPSRTLLGVLTVSAFLLSYLALLFPITEQRANAVIIHGGGGGLVTCSDGSTFSANISFTALGSNGTIAGNWTLYSFGTGSEGLVVGGPIYSGNLSIPEYMMVGNSPDEENAIALCSPPLFGPVAISGSCGREVTITAQFRSNDPLSAEQSFTGSSDCQN